MIIPRAAIERIAKSPEFPRPPVFAADLLREHRVSRLRSIVFARAMILGALLFLILAVSL